MVMRLEAGAGARSAEPPRSTAYYYADIERLKKRNGASPQPMPEPPDESRQNPDELSEYVESNEVVNDGAIQEVPPLRDRPTTLEETYSTAGTFPMPRPKEKEPLLAELETVGRMPLTQLGGGVRRSRSWYLCCPNVADEEASRESSWRYSSLRPVTAAPLPGQNGILRSGPAQSDDAASLRAERDALARALSAERARAAAAARAHDARLAELHGVIAELVRRRAADGRAHAIPEEEVSDECESTTQPAGELELDVEQDLEREPESELESRREPGDTTDTSALEDPPGAERPELPASSAPESERGDTSLDLSERDSDVCASTARCWRGAGGGAGCARGMLPPSPGRCDSRQAKMAARVRLRRTDDSDSSNLINDETWCVEAAERLALDVCAQADLREALVAAGDDECGGAAALWRARCVRLAADCRVLDCALARAVDTAHRLSSACALQESSTVALCAALRCADRALETYDVLLALAETAAHAPRSHERLAAEGVALRLVRRLARAPRWGLPLLSPGPWHDHRASPGGSDGGGSGAEADGDDDEAWSPALEARLRALAARLKSDTVQLRRTGPAPRLYSPHDAGDEEDGAGAADPQAADIEAAVVMQEVLAAREARIAARLAAADKQGESRKGRHWLRAQPETDL